MVAFLRDHEPHMREGTWFHEIYVRDELPTSIADLSLSVSDLADSLRSASQYAGVALATASGNPQLVTGGFALALPGGGVAYGRSDANQIVSLCLLLIHGQDNPAQEAVRELATFAKRHHLLVVEWLMLVMLRPEITATIWEWPTVFTQNLQPKPRKRPWWKFW